MHTKDQYHFLDNYFHPKILYNLYAKQSCCDRSAEGFGVIQLIWHSIMPFMHTKNQYHILDNSLDLIM